ncbi:MAG: UPF0149 family protein [Rhizobacter sp.]|nr:UPF0149 family protein [Rhizobacter sp.]
MAAPELPVAARDLSDAEFRELDGLLADLPEPLMPMDVVMLDGYLCGVIVQPTLVGAERWLPPVFDIESRPPPEGDAGAERIRALVLRRHAALNRALLEDGWFDPLILEDDEDAAAAAGPADADSDAQLDAEGAAEPDPLAELAPISRPIAPWVTGFEAACMTFPGLFDSTDEAVMAALARLFRHLPADNDDEREIIAMLDKDLPLASLDEAIVELVAAVADIAELTQDERYRVETVRRDTPKVGRNDPCPCGSGKKYKLCHGAG